MTIVYLISQHISHGGMERVLSLKANYLVQHGYSVHIVTYLKSEGTPFFYYDPAIRFHHLNFISEKGKKDKQEFLDRLSVVLEEIKPDIVISTGMRIMHSVSTLKDGSKKILEMHFSRYRRKYNRAKLEKFGLGRAILRWYYNKRYQEVKNFDKMVVLSQDDLQSWSLHDLTNLTVIPNPLSFEPSEKSPLTAKRVIAIGRLAYAKAFEVLIEIWSKLEQQYPDWKLSIYGKGEKEKLINKTIKAFRQENRVEILPPVADIRKKILDSSLLAMSSRYEAFGLVLIESMGCGVPPVAFDCKSGPRDILTDGTDGFLVEFGNKEEFARKLSLLMADQELRQKMGEAAFERSKDFTLDKVMPRWIELFDQLVSDRS